jgi:hypothetical protein
MIFTPLYMRALRFSTFLFGWLIVLYNGALCQSGISTLQRDMAQIEKYLYSEPKLAKTDLLLLLDRHTKIPDSLRGELYVKVAVSLGILHQLDSAIILNSQAIDLLRDSPGNLVFAYKNLSILHRLKGEWLKSEESILKGLQINDEHIKDTLHQAILLGELASVYLDQNDPYRATELLVRAIALQNQLQTKDKNTEIILRSRLANAHKSTGNIDFSIQEYKRILSKVSDSHNEFEYAFRGLHLVDAFIHQKSFQSADSLLIGLEKRILSLGNEELLSYLRMKQGLLHASQQDYRNSLRYYQAAFEILEKNDSYYILECATLRLEALIKVLDFATAKGVVNNPALKKALEKGGIEERLKFHKVALPLYRRFLPLYELNHILDEILLLSDSVNAANLRRLALELQAKYRFEQQELAKKTLEEENTLLKQNEKYKSNQTIFFKAIIALILMVLALVTMRHRQKALYHKRELIAQQKEIEFQKERADWIEREQKYRDQLIEEQKAELVRSISLAEETNEKLKQIVSEQEEERRMEILRQIEKSKEEKSGLNTIMSRFYAIYPNFDRNLAQNFPQLSRSDIQFCALFRMNLSTKEIASILHIETRSLYNKKYRVIEKMGLEKENDFDQVILNI